jgi:hypothetical protein
MPETGKHHQFSSKQRVKELKLKTNFKGELATGTRQLTDTDFGTTI